MSRWQAMREVVLPQAVRRVLPVLASTWVSLFKDTSLVSVIAVGELAYTAMRIRSQTFRVLEMLTAMAAIYWALGYPQAKLVDWLNRIDTNDRDQRMTGADAGLRNVRKRFGNFVALAGVSMEVARARSCA